MKVGFVSLGCSKNLIDTEMAIGMFKNNNFEIINDVTKAQIIVINTCGFIEAAKEEAINAILEMCKYKINGNCSYIVVMGCLVQRYIKELEESIPEVDLFIKIDDYSNFWEKIEKLINQKNQSKNYTEFDYLNRIITTGNKTAYLKIAEGCSNKCTYCAIPYIRGKYISRKMEDIIKEAKKLAKEGIKEIIVIAQDTTKYGIDIYGKPKLVELLKTLADIEEFEWIRFLYAYPESITDELIEVVKNNSKICNYFDIPIQHISDKILKKMNRKSNSLQIEKLIHKIREKIPDVILRTSLIVGFPGETDEDFTKLYNFVEKSQFDKLGVFIYSKEEGTAAANLKKQIHHNTKKKRYNEIMELAKEISKEALEKHIGKTYKVLVESVENNKYGIGRTYMDIPETDGTVIIKNCSQSLKDRFITCKIIDRKDYDLIGKIEDI